MASISSKLPEWHKQLNINSNILKSAGQKGLHVSSWTDDFMYFEYVCTDDNSQKYWAIKLTQTGYTRRYGRIGSKGNIVSTTCYRQLKARQEVERLINAKYAKGYRLHVGETTDKLGQIELPELGTTKSKNKSVVPTKRISDEERIKKLIEEEQQEQLDAIDI